MKLLYQDLLLVVILSLQKCQKAEENTPIYFDLSDALDDSYDGYNIEEVPTPESLPKISDLPVPNITVYRQMEDRGRVIVLCEFDRTFDMFYLRSFTLSVESELNYTMETLTSSPVSDTYVFLVTVSPPASFTCEHEVHSNGEDKNLRSQTYTYVLDHHEGVSSFYICFSSFIAVGVVIMTVAVIVTTIRSKAKDSIINPTTTVTDNDYMDA
ncbi:hypothetical protein R3I94_014817 [Phoxinus phoxinus]|uniref:Uncharacterized protein n=1 Tax=Phoxinus phoxinus TaxID=58324 RepID=A0AAN9CPK7_9TELE